MFTPLHRLQPEDPAFLEKVVSHLALTQNPKPRTQNPKPKTQNPNPDLPSPTLSHILTQPTTYVFSKNAAKVSKARRAFDMINVPVYNMFVAKETTEAVEAPRRDDSGGVVPVFLHFGSQKRQVANEKRPLLYWIHGQS